MSNEEIFQTMKDLVAEQFAMEPEEVTMETSFEEIWAPIPWTWWELAMAMEEEFEIGETQEEESERPQDRRGRGELHRGKAE